MADPTLTNIQILRSPVPHKRPDPSLMLDGQLGINYKAVDPGIFTKTVEGTLVKFGPISITNDGLWPNHPTKKDTDGFAGNSHGESWLDGRAAFYSPVEKIYDADKDEWITSSGFTIDNLTGNMTMMKWLTVDKLYANSVDIDGVLEVNGDFLPSGTNCEHDLGTSSNRWKGLYSCLIDTSGNLTVGGDGNISGYVQVGSYLTVNGNADLLGTVTIGTTPASGDTLKVNSPTTFDSTVDIVENATGKGLVLSGHLTAKGNVSLGDGCGVTTFNVYSDTTFHCGATFTTQPLVVDHLKVNTLLESLGNTIIGSTCSDALTVNATATFNCTTEHEGELRIGRVSNSRLVAYGDFTLQGNAVFGGNLSLAGKASSASTVDADPNATLTTKDYVLSVISGSATALGYWNRSGIVISPKNAGDKVESTSTVDGDSATTLVTKDYLLAKVAGASTDLSGDVTLGTTCSDAIAIKGSTTFHCDVVPNADSVLNLGSPTARFANIYTGDLHLKNMRGDWTIIEEEDCLTIRNNKTKQRFAISMTPYMG